jgi:hypothetical protein
VNLSGHSSVTVTPACHVREVNLLLVLSFVIVVVVDNVLNSKILPIVEEVRAQALLASSCL